MIYRYYAKDYIIYWLPTIVAVEEFMKYFFGNTRDVRSRDFLKETCIKLLASDVDASSCTNLCRIKLRSIRCKKLVQEENLVQESMTDMQVSHAS